MVVPEDLGDLNQSTTLTIVVQDENDTEDSPMRFEIEAPEGNIEIPLYQICKCTSEEKSEK